MLKKIISASVMLTFASSVNAIIIGGAVTDIGSRTTNDAFNQGGVFTELTLPFTPPSGNLNSVGDDTFQNPNLYAFNEGQNITVSSDINVNIGSTITAGTVVASHYVFFDPAGNTYQEGYVDFDSDILAVITSTSYLAASDFLLNNNVDYLNPGYRGLESTDSVWIGGTGEESRLYVDWYASTPGDYVRVLTGYSTGGTDPCSTNPPGVGGCPANVPEPPIFALLGIGIIGMIGVARRKRS